MRWWPRSPPAERGSIDHELHARLSRLRSELAQARAADETGAFGDGLDYLASVLKEADRLAAKVTDPRTEHREDVKAMCVLAVHEVEAELCMFKPPELLYPTWIRLRESLYRLDYRRRKAWNSAIEELASPHVEEWKPERLRALRQRSRQLTLELHESALRYNRLHEDREKVMREVLHLGLRFLWFFLVSVFTCLTLSTFPISDWRMTLLSLMAGASGGGMGAVFSRLTKPRDEKLRKKFRRILKSDMTWHVSVGFGSGLLVVAIVLSGRLFVLPDVSIEQVALLVLGGFGAGYSDKLRNLMLYRVIGARSSHSLRTGE